MQGIGGWLRRGNSRKQKRARRLDLAAARKRFLRQPVLEHLEAREAPGSVLHLWMGALLYAVTGGVRQKLDPLSERDLPWGKTSARSEGGLASPGIGGTPSLPSIRRQADLAHHAKPTSSPDLEGSGVTNEVPRVSASVTGRAVEPLLWFVTSTDDPLAGEPAPSRGGGLDAEDFRKYGTDGGAGGEGGGRSGAGGGDSSERSLPPAAPSSDAADFSPAGDSPQAPSSPKPGHSDW